MKYLWAPWRIKYILMEKPKECIFCKAIKENKDDENLILYRGKYSFIILNRFPYNSGHLMIVPYRHVGNIEELTQNELNEMNKLMQKSVKLLKVALKPDGFNIGINIGRVAGAGIEEHIHIHVVPRWNGDTNFMPVIGDTKVVNQYLNETLEVLKKYKEIFEGE
ncbi:MAG: HIT family protein [Candidatus Asgardarchaeia archaeon]